MNRIRYALLAAGGLVAAGCGSESTPAPANNNPPASSLSATLGVDLVPPAELAAASPLDDDLLAGAAADFPPDLLPPASS
jgi:hypothetical protein